MQRTYRCSYLVIRYGLLCSKQVTTARHKEECDFLLSLPQTAILYPTCLSQHTTSQNLAPFRLNFQWAGIQSGRFERPTGRLHILWLRLMMPSVICLDSTGALGLFISRPNYLTNSTGNTLNQAVNQLRNSVRFGNEQEKSQLWSAKPRLPTAGMKATSNITILRGQPIN